MQPSSDSNLFKHPHSASPPKKKEHRIWKSQELESLKTLLQEKMPMEKIQEILGRSQKSIRRKCEESNISSATVYNISEAKIPAPK